MLVAGKDLRQRLRDRSALVIAFVAPFVLASIIGLAFGGDDAFKATYAVADADRGPVAAGFTDGVLASPGLRDLVTVRQVDPGEARALVDRGDADAAFLLPAGFSASVQRGGAATITVVESGENPIAGQVARSLAEAYAAELAATSWPSGPPSTPPASPRQRPRPDGWGSGRPPAGCPCGWPRARSGGRTIEAANYFGPSMAIFFLFFTVSFGARSILAERRQGTMRRLLASAASPGGVLAGKALAAFVLGTASVLVMWLATTLVFGADWGDPVAVVALTVSSVLSAIGVTALVITLARTDEQAEGYSSLVVFTLALLGGNFVYLAQLPELLQRVSLLTPNGWALRGFVDLVADGGGLATVAAPVAVTLGRRPGHRRPGPVPGPADGGGVKALVMAGSALRRLARDRLALFFLVLLPVVIIADHRDHLRRRRLRAAAVGIADEGAGPLGDELRAGLEASPALDPRAYDDTDALGKAVRRGVVSAGVVLPAGYDQALRAGRAAEVTFVVDQTRPAPAPVRSAVSAVVARQAAEVKAARFAAENAGVSFDTALARARALADGQEQVRVEATTIGGREDALPTGFNYTAPANLVLFVFITSLAGAAGLIEARRLGVTRRMLATPTTTSTILFGEALSRFAVALLQGMIIFGVGWLVFGVDWGDPPAALLLVVTFALVGTGVGMLLGARSCATPSRPPRSAPRSASPSACSAAACGPWPSSPSPCASSATCSPRPGPWTPSSP